MRKKKVVILGGGYGGLRAIEHLAQNETFVLTLIDRNPYHYLQTEAYGYIAGRFDIHDITIDLANWCKGYRDGITFLQENVLGYDTQTQTLSTATATHPYDYLIIATGARTNFFSFIDGLREHSYGVKVLERAFNFRTMFEKLIYDKVEAARDDTMVPLHIAIGGAGLSGVEIAAEMAEVIHHHYRTLGSNAERVKLRLIDAAETILPGMHPYIIRETQKRLESIGIEVLTGAFIARVDENSIHLKDGTVLPYHFMIFTGGIKANVLTGADESHLNKLAQYTPDPCLNVGGTENVFAIGDCVELRDRHGNPLPPTAQTAEKSAEYVANVIKKRETGKTVVPFNARIDGVFVALGGHYAVGELFGLLRVRGYTAYVLKKFITRSYHFGLKLRINTGFKKRTNR